MSRNYTLPFYISLLLLTLTLPAVAQFGGSQQSNTGSGNEQPKSREEEMALRRQRDSMKVDTFPLFNRMIVGVDIFDPIANVIGQSYWSSGVVLQVDLKEKFMPTFEFGIARSDRTTTRGVNIKSDQGYYGRVGLDVKALGIPSIGVITAGARLGYASSSYDITGISLSDSYWNESVKDGKIMGENCSAAYLQLVAGARAKVAGKFYMGWTMRYGFLLSSPQTPQSKPFHIPGYGQNLGASTFSFNYYLLFQLPFKESAKPKPKKRAQKK